MLISALQYTLFTESIYLNVRVTFLDSLSYSASRDNKTDLFFSFAGSHGESKVIDINVYHLFPEREVKMVEELIDVCEKGGLDLQPCLMELPMELKGLILERVPGVDLAKVACTCSELRFLCSDNELWKKKCLEESGGESKGSVLNDSKRYFRFQFVLRRFLVKLRRFRVQLRCFQRTLDK